MPIIELIDRSLGPARHQRSYVSWPHTAADGDELAESAVLAFAPAQIAGLDVTDRQVVPYEGLEDVYQVDLTWGAADGAGGSEPEEGQSSYNFDSGTTTQLRTRSLGTTAFGPLAYDFGDGIGYTDDGTFEGVDVVTPTFGFSETHHLAADFVDTSYIATIYALTGKTNSTTYRGFPAGELLFMGASGSKRGSGLWEITYRWDAAANRTGAVRAGISYDAFGFDHVWDYFQSGGFDEDGVLTMPVVGVYVSNVYEAANFSGLAIG